MMITRQEYDNAWSWLAGCRRPLLVTHRRPDGDALGALAAMSLVLRGQGQDPRPVLYGAIPRRYECLRDAATWHQWSDERERLASECDAVLVLDTCAWSQLEPVAEYLKQAPRTLVVDHHPTRDDIGTRPGDLRLLDESAGAVCLILAEWFEAAGLAVTGEVARALLVGIGTDSGWFRHSNTDGRMLRAAGRLVEAGVQPAELYRAIYEQDALGRLRLVGRMLDGLELAAGGRLVVLRLRAADFATAGADSTMTEDLINEAGRLAGTEATVLFTEEADGGVRVNFRSKTWLDVALLAAEFGGGGHTRAAGTRLEGPWDEVVSRVVAAMTAALGQKP